ncbi:MAG: WecB/TagA/CpsF family glycosyltransferase [Candidatus Atribacteria bacterium]|nr:WecB/TagA/CpsF family glycosyltransferase [Candidatus Atribacteria bacterium]MBE3127235.1 WecB/TagA/CpsF family glycosyltransferase [Candidatus Atribacteria bacterium]
MFETGIVFKIAGIVICSVLMVILGKVDRKRKIPTGVKLIFQVLISLIIIYSGVKIEFLRAPSSSSGGYLYLSYLSIPLTIIWLISITNSIGQADELGDITPYIVFIASLTFLVVSLVQRQGLILAESLSLIMAATSFIFIKYVPRGKFSSYYMSFGFILAVIAIVGVSKSTAALTLLIPLLILGVPIIDSSYSIVANYARQESSIPGIGKLPLFSESGSGSGSKLCQKLQSYGFSAQGAHLTIIRVSLYLSLSAFIISIYQNFYLLLTLTAFGWVVFELLKNKVRSEELIIGRDILTSRIKLFQVGIDQVDNQKTIQKIEEFIISKKPHQIVTPDTLAVLRARKDPEYHAILKSAALVTPDGAGILWAATTLNYPLPERVTGIDIIHNICRLAVKKGYSLYLLGSYPGVASETALNLTKKYPGIKIAGTHHGYFNCEDSQNCEDVKNGNSVRNKKEEEIINEIKENKPDILLVGMGVPKQEKWINKNLEKLDVPVCIGVGGSFDVLSGRIPRAPLWMQRHGMEWIYRSIKQPNRAFRVLTLFYFIWLVIVGKIVYSLKEVE